MPFCCTFVKKVTNFEGMLEEKIKIKPLTKQQIIISLDRLTRFKPTEDKYLRVFKDILTSNLIEPKFKKIQLDSMDYSVLTDFAQNIFNYSIEALGFEFSNDFEINQKLMQYEKSIFKLDENTKKLLENKIDYKALIKLLDGGMVIPPYENELPLNLKWLKTLTKEVNQEQNRKKSGLKFPIEKVIIVEGITEEILLPKFAKICGCDFDKQGLYLISAGGKNQVVKLFYKFADNLKLPMFVLLDNDAKENFEAISLKLRPKDRVKVLAIGEFEDILPLNLIKKTLNEHFRNYSSVTLEDLRVDAPMTQVLEDLFKQRGLEFKKAEFASLVAEIIATKDDISPEIEAVILEIN